MNPEVAMVKKRKFFAEYAEESSLPAVKHKCCEASIVSEDKLLLSDMDVMDGQVDSVQDSNSFPGESYDEASTSWTQSNSAECGKSENGAFYSESGILSVTGDGKEDMLTGEKYPRLDDRWDDTGFLGECVSAEHCKDSDQQRAEGLEHFLSCSRMNPNLHVLSQESWSVDQEAQLGGRKPTIDQEFEQYFSMLML